MSDELQGQVDQLESYIRILEKEQSTLLNEIRQHKSRIAELEAQVYGGSTK